MISLINISVLHHRKKTKKTKNNNNKKKRTKRQRIKLLYNLNTDKAWFFKPIRARAYSGPKYVTTVFALSSDWFIELNNGRIDSLKSREPSLTVILNKSLSRALNRQNKHKSRHHGSNFMSFYFIFLSFKTP